MVLCYDGAAQWRLLGSGGADDVSFAAFVPDQVMLAAEGNRSIVGGSVQGLAGEEVAQARWSMSSVARVMDDATSTLVSLLLRLLVLLPIG